MMDAMPKFSIMDLLTATAILALGLAVTISAFSPRWERYLDSAVALIPVCLLFTGCALIGGGIGYLFNKRFALGLYIGLMIALCASFIFVQVMSMCVLAENLTRSSDGNPPCDNLSRTTRSAETTS